ncbi:MAG: Membrane-bound metal-dependent hydrolase [Gammaproteobacteria bacterium]|nr:Membrane-bound metal-dependent hydrolase [Gammaproteobacteria bacterium]
MDNLTHSLIGLIAGESIARATPASRGGLAPDVRRGIFVTLAVVGGNLPDLDLLYSFRGVTHDKLGYLLQHRGYTHTVLGCVLLAALLYAGTQLWARWKRLTFTRHDRLALAAMALFGTLLHLAMDALNSYGVHPLWPVQNRWFYGDSVFIVEPLYWAAAAPLFFVVRSTTARVIIALALLAALILSAVSQLVSPLWCLGFALLASAFLVLGARTSALTAALTSAAFMVAVTAVFIVDGQFAARRIDSIASASFPADRIIDHVLTPMPMNPLCWDVLLLETAGDRYTVRHGVLANAPALMTAAQCPRMSIDRHTTAPMVKVPAPDSGEIHWLGEFAMSKTRLATLVGMHCEAAALMRFARAPFATELERRWIIGDLRFDREPQLGMAEIELPPPSSANCPRTVPWTPPRADLIRGGGAD